MFTYLTYHSRIGCKTTLVLVMFWWVISIGYESSKLFLFFFSFSTMRSRTFKGWPREYFANWQLTRKERRSLRTKERPLLSQNCSTPEMRASVRNITTWRDRPQKEKKIHRGSFRSKMLCKRLPFCPNCTCCRLSSFPADHFDDAHRPKTVRNRPLRNNVQSLKLEILFRFL